jgi:glyoxylase-like metal-dependent hydrolase (beta-lactamase superfamily II)
MKILTHTGGMVETNAYLIETQEGWLAIDAPNNFVSFIKEQQGKVAKFFLTHGHWDHMEEASELKKEFQCPVYAHHGDDFLYHYPKSMILFGAPSIPAIQIDHYLEEGDVVNVGEYSFKTLFIPGHSPGSILFYEEKEGVIFGGDVLFRGAVGRWDLPQGSKDQLLTGIRKKLMTLPEDVIVYPGHGEPTTIGREKKENGYLQEV